jgi:hypothetical protein
VSKSEKKLQHKFHLKIFMDNYEKELSLAIYTEINSALINLLAPIFFKNFLAHSVYKM